MYNNFVRRCTLLIILTFLTNGNALTHIVDVGSKQYFMSQYQTDFNKAKIACRSKGMVIAMLATEMEHDMVIAEIQKRPHLPGRAFIGLYLNRFKQVLISETNQMIPYKLKYYPRQPSGDGVCLEILRGRTTGINDLSCHKHRRHFICENNVNPPTITYPTTTSVLTTTPIPTTTTIPKTTPIPTTTHIPATTTEAELTHLTGNTGDRKCICDNSDAQVQRDVIFSDASSNTKKNVIDESRYNNTNMAVFDLVTGAITFKNRKSGIIERKSAHVDFATYEIVLNTNETDNNDLDHIETLRVVYKKIDLFTGHVIVEIIEPEDIIFDPVTQRMWVLEGRHASTGNTIYTSTQEDHQTGFITTFYGVRKVKNFNIDIVTSVESQITRLHSSSLQVITNSGEIDSVSALPIYVINDIDVVSGEVYDKIAKIDSNTGELIVIKVILPMQRDEHGLPLEVRYESIDIDPVTRRVQAKKSNDECVRTDTTTSETFRLQGTVHPVTGQIQTRYGNIDPNTGDIDPRTAVKDPATGQLILNAKHINPKHFNETVTIRQNSVPVSVPCDQLNIDSEYTNGQRTVTKVEKTSFTYSLH